MIEIVSSVNTQHPFSTYVVPDVTTEEEPCYMAYHLELDGCMSHGETPEEALQNLNEVTEIYLSALSERGIDIPHILAPQVTWEVVAEVESAPTAFVNVS